MSDQQYGPKMYTNGHAKVRFSPEINLGAVVQSLVVFVAFVGFIWTQSSSFAKRDIDVAGLQSDGREIKASISDLNMKMATIVHSDAIQTDRINNLSLAATENRAVNTEILRQLSTIREQQAAFTARINAGSSDGRKN